MAFTEEQRLKGQETRRRNKELREQKKARAEARAAQQTESAPSGVENSAEEQLVDVTINLAPNAECLTVNGVAYWHGKDYKVSADLARDLNAMAGATWTHERQIHGENENQFRRQTHRRLSPR